MNHITVAKSKYVIIRDPEKLRAFIEWLPDLGENETYYVCLFARNKYCGDVKHIASDKAQVKRFTANKGNLYDKIKQLEVEEGSYVQTRYEERKEIPQVALALYISVNPRDNRKAIFKLFRKLTDIIETQAKGFNLHQEALSAIQKTAGKKYFVDFDFDISEENIPRTKQSIEEFINKEAITYLKTRSGMHVLIRLDKIEEKYTKTWHKNINSLEGTDVSGDTLIPVPGCTQGNYTPHFI